MCCIDDNEQWEQLCSMHRYKHLLDPNPFGFGDMKGQNQGDYQAGIEGTIECHQCRKKKWGEIRHNPLFYHKKTSELTFLTQKNDANEKQGTSNCVCVVLFFFNVNIMVLKEWGKSGWKGEDLFHYSNKQTKEKKDIFGKKV